MCPRFQSLLLALVAALLVILGTFGIFTAEASSVQTIVSEVQTYGTVIPPDAAETTADDLGLISIPGLPY